MTIDPQNGPDVTHCRHRHIADIQHPGVRTQATYPFGHNCRRVRVVHDPRLLIRVLLYQVDKLNHRQNGAQAVSQAAWPTGLLAYYAVAQRDLLILLAHFVLPDAHLGKDKVCSAEGGFGIAGNGKFNRVAVVADHLLHHRGQRALTCLIDIIEADLRQRKILQPHHQAFDDAWRIGAAAAGDGQNKWGGKHVCLLQRNASTASRIFLTCSP